MWGKRSDGTLVKLRLGLSLEPSEICPLICALMEELDDRSLVIRVERASGRILSVEGEPRAIFGLRADELVGRDSETLIRKSTKEYQVGLIRNLEALHCRGHRFPVSVELTGTDSSSTSLLVTEIDSALEGVVNMDALGIITSVSRSCRILFGYNSEEMIGLPFDRFCRNLSLKTGKSVPSCCHKDGSRFFLVVSITEYVGDHAMPHFKAVLHRSIQSTSLSSVSTSYAADSARTEIAGLVGWYSIIKVLGRGSFGSVSQATHRLTGLPVAIKPLEEQKYAELKMSFPPREIELMWRLKHPHIVHLYDILYAKDAVYLIMEIVGGGELFDFVLQKERLSEHEARKLFREIVSAVDYMHRSGVVHRDIKLENILLDNTGCTKLIDLGLGNFFGHGNTLSTFCGSPDYCAPELWQAKSYNGPEVDIWSLGVVLFIMTTGFAPFNDSHAILNITYSFLSTASLSDEIRDLFMQIFQFSSMRISMENLLKHPWLNDNGKLPMVDRISLRSPTRHLDASVVAQMEDLGFSAADVSAAVLSDAHDQISTTYYLLVRNSDLIKDAATL